MSTAEGRGQARSCAALVDPRQVAAVRSTWRTRAVVVQPFKSWVCRQGVRSMCILGKHDTLTQCWANAGPETKSRSYDTDLLWFNQWTAILESSRVHSAKVFQTKQNLVILLAGVIR